jgi:hypothetical protein
MSVITKHTVAVPLDLSSPPPAGSIAIWDGVRFKLSNTPSTNTIVSNSGYISAPTASGIYIGGIGGFNEPIWSIKATLGDVDAQYFNCFTRLTRNSNKFRVFGAIGASGTISGNVYMIHASFCGSSIDSTVEIDIYQSEYSINSNIKCFDIDIDAELLEGDFVCFGIEVEELSEVEDLKFTYTIQDIES